MVNNRGFFVAYPLVLSKHNSLTYKTNKNKYCNIKSFKYNLTYVKCSRNFEFEKRTD